MGYGGTQTRPLLLAPYPLSLDPLVSRTDELTSYIKCAQNIYTTYVLESHGTRSDDRCRWWWKKATALCAQRRTTVAGMFGENPLQMLIPIAILIAAVIAFAFMTAGY